MDLLDAAHILAVVALDGHTSRKISCGSSVKSSRSRCLRKFSIRAIVFSGKNSFNFLFPIAIFRKIGNRLKKVIILNRTLMIFQKVSKEFQYLGSFPTINFFNVFFHKHLHFLLAISIKQKACPNNKKAVLAQKRNGKRNKRSIFDK